MEPTACVCGPEARGKGGWTPGGEKRGLKAERGGRIEPQVSVVGDLARSKERAASHSPLAFTCLTV